MRYRVALIGLDDEGRTPDLPDGVVLLEPHYRYAGGLGAQARPWAVTVALPEVADG